MIAVSGPNGTVTEEHVFPVTRAEVMVRISERVLELLRDQVKVAR